jgi:hypothetical protein
MHALWGSPEGALTSGVVLVLQALGGVHVEVGDQLGVAHEGTPATGPGLVLSQLPGGNTENHERCHGQAPANAHAEGWIRGGEDLNIWQD